MENNLEDKKIKEQQSKKDVPEQQSTQKLDDSLTRALSYFGPRLAAQLLGGSVAMQTTDKLLTGYEQAQERERKMRESQLLAQQQAGEDLEERVRKERQIRVSEGNLALRKKEIEQSLKRTKNLEEQRGLLQQERLIERSMKVVSDFESKDQVKNIKKRNQVLNEIEDIITDAPEIAAGTIGFKIAKGIAGEVGNLTNEERKAAQISPSFIRNIKRQGSKFLRGRLPEEDVKELEKIVKALRAKNRLRLKDMVDRTVKVSAKYTNPEELREELYSKMGISEAVSVPDADELTEAELKELQELEELERQGKL